MVMEKEKTWIVPVRFANPVKEFDQRHSQRQTWRSIVLSALEACGGTASLTKVYQVISSHVRAKEAVTHKVDWQAIVRRELQEGPFQSSERGVWSLASGGHRESS